MPTKLNMSLYFKIKTSVVPFKGKTVEYGKFDIKKAVDNIYAPKKMVFVCSDLKKSASSALFFKEKGIEAFYLKTKLNK